MSYYAVANGRQPGIYRTWEECKTQVHQFSKPVYKKFKTEQEALNFITTRSVSSSTSMSLLQQFHSTSSKRQHSSSGSDDDIEIIKHKKQKNHTMACTGLAIVSMKNSSGFKIDENGYTEVYTDGACSSNGKGNAKAGIGVWFYESCPFNVSKPVIGRPTNNMAEIQAVTIAATKAQEAGIKKLKIITDSQFLISCITQWMPKWKRNGWKTATGKDVINKQELIEMEKALAPLQVAWKHVRGHVGIHGNEMADKLAVEGASKYVKS